MGLGNEVRCTPHTNVELPVGATALVAGQIVKLSSNLLVTAADDDKQGQFFVTREKAAADATKCLVTYDANATWEMEYDSAPTVGASYGISDGRTIDVDDTTNLLVTVLKVDTDRERATVTFYQKTA